MNEKISEKKQSISGSELEKCTGGSKRPVHVDNSITVKDSKDVNVSGGKTVIINMG